MSQFDKKMENPIKLDCGDSSCRYAEKKGGMRTNGGCRCADNNGRNVERYLSWQHSQDAAKIAELEAEVEALILKGNRWREIAEANEDRLLLFEESIRHSFKEREDQLAEKVKELEKLHSMEAEAHHKTASLYRQARLEIETLKTAREAQTHNLNVLNKEWEAMRVENEQLAEKAKVLEAEVKRLEAEHKPVIKADGGTYTISATITTAKESQLAEKLRETEAEAKRWTQAWAERKAENEKLRQVIIRQSESLCVAVEALERIMAGEDAWHIAKQALEKIRGSK